MAASQTKQEKKVMDEKIAKVREVVRNASTNDIVLALHNFELDVERTIHALSIPGGKESALGKWETGTKKRQQKNKVKSAAQAPSQNDGRDFAVPARRPLTNEKGNVQGKLQSTVSSGNGYSNGYKNNNSNEKQVAQQQQQFNAGDAIFAVNNIKPSLKHDGSELNGGIKQDTSYAPFSSSSSTTGIASGYINTDPMSKSANVAPRQMTLQKYGNDEKDSQMDRDIFNCFQELRQILAKRESELAAQLMNCRQAHFLYDNSKVIREIAQLGEVVPSGIGLPQHSTHHQTVASPTTTNGQSVSVNHSTSHSSLVSSVGEDSGLGLGQTSPLQEKSVAHVYNGGIVMQSDALSTEQLADIQRHLADRLRSQGKSLNDSINPILCQYLIRHKEANTKTPNNLSES